MDTPTIFAPVIIPTLCRYDHFKSCLESLMRCTWADKTDVYIGLDYPLKESHWDGYKKISEYLTKIENNHTFKSLNVIRRERNYGFGPNGNSANLREFVLSKYDYFIFSEDDNIFSPAFLDYINKGLEKFKDDPTVLAICGYRHFYNLKFENNTFYRQNVDFSAWGYGMWKKQYYIKDEIINNRYWRRKAYNLKNWVNIIRNGWNRTRDFIYLIHRTPTFIDNTISVFMGLNNISVICPYISLVRNNGWDGSGEHCLDENLALSHNQQPLYKSDYFEFRGSGNELHKENHIVHVEQSYGRISLFKFLTNIVKRIFRPTSESL